MQYFNGVSDCCNSVKKAASVKTPLGETSRKVYQLVNKLKYPLSIYTFIACRLALLLSTVLNNKDLQCQSMSVHVHVSK